MTDHHTDCIIHSLKRKANKRQRHIRELQRVIAKRNSALAGSRQQDMSAPSAALLERLRDALPKVGESEESGCCVRGSDLRAAVALLDQPAQGAAPTPAELTNDECDRLLAESLDAVARQTGHGLTWADVNTDIATNRTLRHELIRRAAARAAAEFERGRQQGMQQERALWQLAADGQRIERAAQPTQKAAEPAAVPEGWQLVPIEPTIEMLLAGDSARLCEGYPTRTGPSYEAMLAVAPSAPLNAEEAQPAVVRIRCPDRLKNNGVCPHHNLLCGWPDCNKDEPRDRKIKGQARRGR